MDETGDKQRDIDYELLSTMAEIAEIEDVLARLRYSSDGLARINLWCLEELLRRKRASLPESAAAAGGDTASLPH